MITHAARVHAFSINGQRGNAAIVFATGAHERVDVDACAATADRLQCEVTWIHRDATPRGSGLRFFTPGGEIAFCGHGTLAAAAWLAARDGGAAAQVFDVGGAPIRVEQDAHGRWSYLQEAGGSEPVDGDALVDALAALGLRNPDALRAAGAALARSIGAPRDKLFVALPDAAALRDIALDPARRDALCTRLDTTGLYAYAVCDAAAPRLVARHFPLRCGMQEDMATAGIAPTVVRHAGFAAAAGDVVIDQGGPDCGNARLVVAAGTGSARRVAGECVIVREMPLAGVVAALH
ncbi:phenazine biosynthesis protein [Burkholderia stagnalis]|uniref:PhzF family phenazine biosynthesis protein n=1 Tax=Burkholderia stagnalis TaxID=1503054 RepID=UPI00075FAF5F|nr:PhzF family phenazine biosynthesis protein [Burkholderia stagnalis]KWK48287.1 phenazine biosynthesis protein [Burkholderia stagnalis]KWK54619.1 phenazine biosynthesis protein [Burkholderia stagnalis]KWN76306.1 phenazine biosynthesis protein [Burkholderia stagnalis]